MEESKEQPELTEKEVEEAVQSYMTKMAEQEKEVTAIAKAVQQKMFAQGRPKFTVKNVCSAMNWSAVDCQRMFDMLKLSGFLLTHKGSDQDYFEICTDLNNRIANMTNHAKYMDYMATTYAMTSKHIMEWVEFLVPTDKKQVN